MRSVCGLHRNHSWLGLDAHLPGRQSACAASTAFLHRHGCHVLFFHTPGAGALHGAHGNAAAVLLSAAGLEHGR
eukprot:1158006-Pelagomonas_calceolata.AAC.5